MHARSASTKEARASYHLRLAQCPDGQQDHGTMHLFTQTWGFKAHGFMAVGAGAFKPWVLPDCQALPERATVCMNTCKLVENFSSRIFCHRHSYITFQFPMLFPLFAALLPACSGVGAIQRTMASSLGIYNLAFEVAKHQVALCRSVTPSPTHPNCSGFHA